MKKKKQKISKITRLIKNEHEIHSRVKCSTFIHAFIYTLRIKRRAHAPNH